MTTDTQALLYNLVEEAAEVAQIGAKILRFGPLSHHPDDPEKTTNLVRLARELGNLLYVADRLGLPAAEIEQGRRRKEEGVKKYGLARMGEKT